MSLSVCICSPKPNADAISRLVVERLKGKVKQMVCGQGVADFASIKASSEPFALVVDTAIAHDVLRDLCDDYRSASRRVQFIYSVTTGVDSYRLHQLEQQVAGIPIYNAKGCFSNILAEHVVFAIQYFNRQCWRLSANKASKKFEKYNMIEMKGQKIGIIGYGDIGQRCGKLAASVGMEVTGIRRSAREEGFVDEYGVRVLGEAALDDVLHTSDFIVGVLPGTSATAHFFGKHIFTKMKRDAVFINIGRGSTQNEADIMAALTSGTIRGAALDVFEVEPLPPSSPLWNLPDDKLLLTPHNADWTDKLLSSTALRFVDIFEKYVANIEILEHLVDVKKGY